MNFEDKINVNQCQIIDCDLKCIFQIDEHELYSFIKITSSKLINFFNSKYKYNYDLFNHEILYKKNTIHHFVDKFIPSLCLDHFLEWGSKLMSNCIVFTSLFLVEVIAYINTFFKIQKDKDLALIEEKPVFNSNILSKHSNINLYSNEINNLYDAFLESKYLELNYHDLPTLVIEIVITNQDILPNPILKSLVYFIPGLYENARNLMDTANNYNLQMLKQINELNNSEYIQYIYSIYKFINIITSDELNSAVVFKVVSNLVTKSNQDKKANEKANEKGNE